MIQVPFTHGIAFEVVPGFINKDDSYTFPNANGGGSWETTNPKPEIAAIRSRNNVCNGNLVPLCRHRAGARRHVGRAHRHRDRLPAALHPMDAPTPDMTKWKRLFNASGTRQNHGQNRRAIQEFIRRAIKPERYAREPHRFEPMRANLNRALAISGLAVEASGKLVGVKQRQCWARSPAAPRNCART